MTREKLKQILIDFFKSNPHLVQILIDKGIFLNKHMTVDKFISEIELEKHHTFGWVLSDPLCWGRKDITEHCPIKYVGSPKSKLSLEEEGMWIYEYKGDYFRVEGLENVDVDDVYTVEYKEVPVMMKKWVKVEKPKDKDIFKEILNTIQ